MQISSMHNKQKKRRDKKKRENLRPISVRHTPVYYTRQATLRMLDRLLTVFIPNQRNSAQRIIYEIKTQVCVM